MRKVRKRIVSLITTTALMLTLAPVVSAETQTINYDSTVDESSGVYSNVSVEAERAELYTVTLPKAVTLEVSDTTGTFDYDVTVNGEISSNHYVRVIPLGNAKIVDENEIYSYDLNVSQEKRRWAPTEIDGTIKGNGTFIAEGLEPGKYNGTVRYFITCDDGCIWEAATCTEPATCLGEDINDNGVLDTEDLNNNDVLDDGEDLDADGVIDTEYFDTVRTRGTALGHKFAEDDTAFPAVCERCKTPVYAIRTPEQLTSFKDSVNNGNTYAGADVILNNDIDMTGVVWNKGIGGHGTANYFAGNFDGFNHTISNLTLDYDITAYSSGVERTTTVGLFGYLGSTGTCIKNFTLDNATYVLESTGNCSSYYIGFIVGNMYSENTLLQNVHVRNSNMSITDNTYDGTNVGLNTKIGGLVGYTRSIIDNCSVVNTTVYTTNNVYSITFGGIAGEARNGVVISNTLAAADAIISAKMTYMHAMISSSDSSNVLVQNSVYDTSLISKYTNTGSSFATQQETNCLGTDTAGCQTQDAVDILNTDNENCVWKLDLEDVNKGYPIIK